MQRVATATRLSQANAPAVLVAASIVVAEIPDVAMLVFLAGVTALGCNSNSWGVIWAASITARRSNERHREVQHFGNNVN